MSEAELDRQSIIDEDQTESDIVRAGLIEELRKRGHEPEFDVVWMKSAEAAQILNRIENELHRPLNRAMTHLYMLNIPEIRKANRARPWMSLDRSICRARTRFHAVEARLQRLRTTVATVATVLFYYPSREIDLSPPVDLRFGRASGVGEKNRRYRRYRQHNFLK